MPVLIYKCPNCDGDVRFDPESQGFKCEYCESVFSQEELLRYAPNQSKEAASSCNRNDDKGGAVIYSCPTCGAEIVTDSTTAATFCFYCHNPVVLSGRLEGEYSPDKIIPVHAVARTGCRKVPVMGRQEKIYAKGIFQ